VGHISLEEHNRMSPAINRLGFPLLMLLLLLAAAGPASARDGYPRWAGDGPVLKGYDAAGYHTDGSARPGKADQTVAWAGGTFRFATQAAADRFRANPKLFRVYKGNLYVFASPAGPRRFDKDPEGVIAAARAYAKKVGVVE
jgi:YHS domain-containing protein